MEVTDAGKGALCGRRTGIPAIAGSGTRVFGFGKMSIYLLWTLLRTGTGISSSNVRQSSNISYLNRSHSPICQIALGSAFSSFTFLIDEPAVLRVGFFLSSSLGAAGLVAACCDRLEVVGA